MAENARDRPKGRSLQSLKFLWPFLRPYRGILLASIVALLVASAALLVLPAAGQKVIDRGMAAGNAETVNRYFFAFLGAAGLMGVFAALRAYLVSWLGERVIADIRAKV